MVYTMLGPTPPNSDWEGGSKTVLPTLALCNQHHNHGGAKHLGEVLLVEELEEVLVGEVVEEDEHVVEDALRVLVAQVLNRGAL